MADRLTELAHDVERATVPDFDQVLARARSRSRRKRGLVAGIVLALVAGGALAVADLPDSAETAPPVTQHPRKQHPKVQHLTHSERIQQALDRGTTELVAAADPGHVLIVREYCPAGPRHCWWGSKITGVPDSTRPESQVDDRGASAGANGFWIGGEGPFLGLDGRVHRTAMRYLPLSRASRPGPDAVFTMLNDNGFLVYEPTRHRYWGVRLPGVTQPPIRQLLLTDDGTIWMQQDDGMRPAVISSSDDGGRTWTHHALPRERSTRFGNILWHAGTVGVPVYRRDGVLRSIQVLDGDHWTGVPADGPLSGLTGKLTPVGAEPNIAGLTDGGLVVRDNDFRVWQAAADSWTQWRVVSRRAPVLALTGSRDVLLGVGDDHHTAFRWTGTSWQELG
ncbi:MAG TPA: hypothetical protein VFR99_02760 [Marmoricola sp.]|nr:hypothetical protein [Marmoricola sp.]